MRICAIDTCLPESPLLTASTDYFSLGTLEGFDVALWSPGHLYQVLCATGVELTVGASAHLFAASRHWRRQFQALWARGGTIVVFLPAQAILHAHHFEDLIDVNLLDSLGGHLPELAHGAPPVRPLTPGGSPFLEFFARTEGLWDPRAQLTGTHATPILRTNDGAIVAAYEPRLGGRLLWLPQIAPQSAPTARGTLLEALSLLIAQLSDPALIVNAGWLDQVTGIEQNARNTTLATLRETMTLLQAQIDGIEAENKAHAFRAQLIAGTGRGVFHAVAQAVQAIAGPDRVARDWLDDSLLVVRRPNGAHVVKTLIHGEAIDDKTLAAIATDVERLTWEHGKVRGTTLVDCRDNALPLHGRGAGLRQAEREALGRHRWAHTTGTDLFVRWVDVETGRSSPVKGGDALPAADMTACERVIEILRQS